MQSLRFFFIPGCLIALASVVSCSAVRAEKGVTSSKHYHAALSPVFDERVLQDNAEAVCDHVKSLPAKQRFSLLTQWVLPNSHRSNFRLTVSFHIPDSDSDITRSNGGALLPPLLVVANMESPSFELVRAASELNRLTELRETVGAVPPGDSMHERCRRSLLIMIDIESGATESAQKQLAAAGSDLHKLTRRELAIPCPETLAVFQGIQHDATRDISLEILSFLVDSLIRVDRISSNDPQDRTIAALAGWAQAQNAADAQSRNNQAQFRLTQWAPVSRITQRTRGSGFPSAFWAGRRGVVNNITSHDEDYLYFQSPLYGNYEVECDVTTVQWRHSHLMVCGNWIAPVWGVSRVDVGGFQRLLKHFTIDPPLSPLVDWIRYRTVVHNDVRSTFINGRLVDEQQLSADHDPWLAVRSPWYSEGGVRNLRITGQPEIPETVRLSPQPGLDQWVPGFDAIVGHDWLLANDANGDQIVGVKRNAQLSGTYCESVLQYHRPMLEDGTIEYDFLYKEHDVHVHPSFDDVALLLLPDRVRLHRMTNGVYDLTDTDPTLAEDASTDQRDLNALPFKHNDWNHIQLNLTGSIVRVSLNGALVLEQPLKPTGRRRFGLFHYADQTQAVVRNIRWSGTWPKSLPLESEQELADPEQSFRELDGTQVFRHDFAKDGIPEELFSKVGFRPDGPAADPGADGLQVQCRGQEGYIACFISPNLQAEGDFDLTARFERLKTVGGINRSSGVFLTAVVAGAPMTENSVYRGLIQHGNEPLRQLTLAQVFSHNIEGGRTTWSPALSEESTFGRLRLLRRGKRLRFLFAEGDSSQFRLVSEEDVSDAPLTADGIRLVAMTHESTGLAEVVWKDIEVRATTLTGPAMENRAEVVEELGRMRDQLSDSFVYDFTNTPPDSKTFFRWRDTRPWDNSTGGLKINAEGAEQWSTSGINIHREITGDFDFVVSVKDLKLSIPAAGQVSGLYLVIPVSDKDRTHATLHFRKLEDGRTVAVMGTGKRIAGSEVLTTIRTIDFKSVSALRVTRNKETLTCLMSSPDFDRDQIIATVNFPTSPVPSAALQIHLHTGGVGRESQVVIPRIEIRADKISND